MDWKKNFTNRAITKCHANTPLRPQQQRHTHLTTVFKRRWCEPVQQGRLISYVYIVALKQNRKLQALWQTKTAESHHVNHIVPKRILAARRSSHIHLVLIISGFFGTSSPPRYPFICPSMMIVIISMALFFSPITVPPLHVLHGPAPAPFVHLINWSELANTKTYGVVVRCDILIPFCLIMQNSCTYCIYNF